MPVPLVLENDKGWYLIHTWRSLRVNTCLKQLSAMAR